MVEHPPRDCRGERRRPDQDLERALGCCAHRCYHRAVGEGAAAAVVVAAAAVVVAAVVEALRAHLKKGEVAVGAAEPDAEVRRAVPLSSEGADVPLHQEEAEVALRRVPVDWERM